MKCEHRKNVAGVDAPFYFRSLAPFRSSNLPCTRRQVRAPSQPCSYACRRPKASCNPRRSLLPAHSASCRTGNSAAPQRRRILRVLSGLARVSLVGTALGGWGSSTRARIRNGPLRSWCQAGGREYVRVRTVGVTGPVGVEPMAGAPRVIPGEVAPPVPVLVPEPVPPDPDV